MPTATVAYSGVAKRRSSASDTFAPQVESVIISANRNLAEYRALGVPVVTDASDEFLGPLAGIASGLEAATTGWVAVAPCDSPLLAADCVERLASARDDNPGTQIAVAHDGGRIQPMFALIRRDLRQVLDAFLGAGERKLDRWYAHTRCSWWISATAQTPSST